VRVTDRVLYIFDLCVVYHTYTFESLNTRLYSIRIWNSEIVFLVAAGPDRFEIQNSYVPVLVAWTGSVWNSKFVPLLAASGNAAASWCRNAVDSKFFVPQWLFVYSPFWSAVSSGGLVLFSLFQLTLNILKQYIISATLWLPISPTLYRYIPVVHTGNS